MSNMLVPLPLNGSVEDFKKREPIKGYEWITRLSTKNIYLSLFQRWPDCNLPLGYDLYIISFHLEAVDIHWLKSQVNLISGEIIVLSDGSSNNYTLPKVRFLSYYYWHHQLNTMSQWFQHPTTKNITHKASAFCNRITSTKLTVFTALAEYIGTDNCILVLHKWLEEKNIIHDNDYVPILIRELHKIFFDKYYGNEYTIDDFNDGLNQQKYTANPWQPSYQNCAIHFTNESFDNSDIYDKALYSYPGPFITEKTLKCLLGKTAFIPNGQFDTYGALSRLGFEFDYNLDLSFDAIHCDNDRLNKVVLLIKQLSSMSKEEIYTNTKDSSEYNHYYIINGEFYKHCEMLNEHTVEQVMEHIDLVTG